MSEAEEFLVKLAQDLEDNPPVDKKGGHKALLDDLILLLKDAVAFEFDDFRNKKYSAPKLALNMRLMQLAENNRNSKYDN